MFEPDSYDADTRTGWSVLVKGLAETIDSADEVARFDAVGLSAWGGDGSSERWVRIRPSSITGRRIAATSPGQA